MTIYDKIRAKIEDLGGVAGPVGSFNPTGGREIKIEYNTPSGAENHHIVPYLIGTSPDPTLATDVQRLVAYKYKGTTAHPSKGWRCYKVEEIASLLSSPAQRPNQLPKLKLKRQNCVDIW